MVSRTTQELTGTGKRGRETKNVVTAFGVNLNREKTKIFIVSDSHLLIFLYLFVVSVIFGGLEVVGR